VGRQQIGERQVRNSKGKRSRSIYVWSALGLAAFVLGGIVAFLATDSRSDGPLPTPESVELPVPAAVQAQSATPQGAALLPGRASEKLAPGQAAPAVRLDDLPVEPVTKK